MEIPLWTLIPAIIVLTSFYLMLGVNGYWNYTSQDFMYGNAIVSLLVGLFYISEGIYKKLKKENGKLV